MLSEHFGCWARHAPLTLFDCDCDVTVSPVRSASTHDPCTRQDSGMSCDSDVIEKPSRRWRGAVQQLADVVEKVSFRATTPAPVIVRATFP